MVIWFYMDFQTYITKLFYKVQIYKLVWEIKKIS